MRKNRVLSALLVIGMITWILFTAGGLATAEAAEPQKIAFIYVSSVGDLGWSYEHDNGRKMMEAKLGDKVKTAIIESGQDYSPVCHAGLQGDLRYLLRIHGLHGRGCQGFPQCLL